jgi:hypothetical protein
MRVMTRERRVGVELADDLPTYTGHSGKFMLKLIAAWIAMGFRRPEITLGKTVRMYCGPVLRHPAELLPAVDLGGRVWLGGKPCKGWPAAPAFGG